MAVTGLALFHLVDACPDLSAEARRRAAAFDARNTQAEAKAPSLNEGAASLL